MSPNLIRILLPIIIIVPILFLRARRMGKMRPLKLRYMMIRPALILIIAGLVLFLPQPGHPAHVIAPQEWAALAIAVLVGAAAGWQLGRTMAIEVHPESGTLMARGNMIGLLVIGALVLLKAVILPQLEDGGVKLPFDPTLLADASILFSVGLFSAQFAEMFLRARRVMAAVGKTIWS